MRHIALFKVIACAAALYAQDALTQQPSAPKPIVGGDPRVAPDGARILFSSNRSGKTQLYIMNADGSALRQLTTDSSEAFSGNWSPDGRRVVYVSSRDEIVIVNADGTGKRVVNVAKGNQAPSWSPDGTKILFAGGEFPNINIHAMNVDGTDRRNIAPNPGFDYDPVWSPDGKTIAFVSGIRGQGPRVYVMNVDGSGRRRVTSMDGGEERPAWSRSGRELAFQVSTRGSAPRRASIYIANIVEGTVRRVGKPQPWLDETPSWFPDGKRLAIQSDRDGSWSIYVVDLEGTTIQQLTKR
jgi:TolB protein